MRKKTFVQELHYSEIIKTNYIKLDVETFVIQLTQYQKMYNRKPVGLFVADR